MTADTIERKPAADAQFVVIKKAADLTGYSVAAIQTKIHRGIWLEGHEYIRAPDGRVLIDMHGYRRWVAGQRRAV